MNMCLPLLALSVGVDSVWSGVETGFYCCYGYPLHITGFIWLQRDLVPKISWFARKFVSMSVPPSALSLPFLPAAQRSKIFLRFQASWLFCNLHSLMDSRKLQFCRLFVFLLFCCKQRGNTLSNFYILAEVLMSFCFVAAVVVLLLT